MHERRRFFRIDTTVGLAVEHLTEAQLRLRQKHDTAALNAFNVSFDARLSTLLNSLRVTHPVVAEAVDLINKKINATRMELGLSADREVPIDYLDVEVNLSACGLAFWSADELVAGAYLDAHLLMQPGNVALSSLSRVVGVAPEDNAGESGWRVRLDFVGMSGSDQEVLIQNVMQMQTRLLRSQRKDTEN